MLMHSGNVHLVLIAGVLSLAISMLTFWLRRLVFHNSECLCLHQLQQVSTARYVTLEPSRAVKKMSTM